MRHTALGNLLLAVLIVLAFSLIWIWPQDRPAEPPKRPIAEQDAASAAATRADWLEADCWFAEPWSDLVSFHRPRCAWLYPSVKDSNGEPAALPIVLLHQQRFRRPSQRATVYVMGGPGGSSWLSAEGVRGWAEWSKHLGLDHDLVLYDQRGTGYARPPIDCPELDQLSWQQLDSEADNDSLWADYEAVLSDCAEQIPEADRASGLYSTATNAQDLRELIAALKRELGYQSVNVYGVSYGTRLAMVALADPQAGAEAVVLDSLYPPGVDLDGSFADYFADLLNRAAGHCVDTGHCQPTMQLRSTLDQALAELASRPQRLSVQAEWLETPQMVRIDDAQLMALVKHSLYAGIEVDELERLLVEAVDAQLQGWQPWIDDWLWANTDTEFDMLTLHLTECRDNPRLDPAIEAAALARQPSWRHALASPERSFMLCDVLGVPAAPLSPVQLEIPVLALAAEFDPRTPADLGLAAVQSYPKLQQLRRPLSGHGLVDIDDCAAKSVGQFLNHGGRYRLRQCPPVAGELEPHPPVTAAAR